MITPQDALYSKYMAERKGAESIWRDHGFIFYKIIPHSKECFILEFFVEKDVRNIGYGHEMLDELCRIADARGSEIITANIHVQDAGCNNTLRAAIQCGFKVVASDSGVILISKKVKGL